MRRDEWDKLTPDEQWQYVQVVEALLAERQRVLDAIPPCPEHGECVPHALEWIARRKLQMMAVNLDPYAPIGDGIMWTPHDDKGNPPPIGMIGDMIPVWYDGQWWTCFDTYQQRKRQNGEQP